MQLIKSAIVFASFLTAASAVVVDVSTDVDAKMKRDLEMEARDLDSGSLEKRACKNNGCKCKKGTKQGQYCGLCDAVTDAGDGYFTQDIFECNTSGGCCDYGRSTHCSSSNWVTWCPK